MSVTFEHCIRCTLCVENCPVFKVNEHYPGPKQAGPNAQRFRLDDQKIDEAWIKYCTQCHRCQTACPYGVDPAHIIRRAQLAYGRTHWRSFSAVLFANNYYLGLTGSTLAPIFNRVSRLGLVRRFMQALGISKYLPFPSFNLRSLRISRKHSGRGQRKVAFFYGCFLNYNQPQLGRIMRDFLASTGLEVVLPPQVCCGLPALGNGDLKTALRFAKKNAKVLGRYIEQGYDVVYACTSCGHTRPVTAGRLLSPRKISAAAATSPSASLPINPGISIPTGQPSTHLTFLHCKQRLASSIAVARS